MRLLSAQEQKRLDVYLVKQGVPLLLLMEAAGSALADAVSDFCKMQQKSWVDLLIGPGMNGGDLYVAARKLYASGVDVRVWECQSQRYSEDYSSPAYVMRNAALACGITPRELGDFEPNVSVVVDGLLGTGFQPDRILSSELEEAFEKMQDARDMGAEIVACDLPSGISANDGFVSPFTVKADCTVTFIAPKIGMCSSPARQFCGQIRVSDLQLPAALFEDFWRQDNPQFTDTSLFPDGVYTLSEAEALAQVREVAADTHKWKQGNLLVLAGSPGMAGAASLALEGALRMGCGLVSMVCDRAIYPELFHAHPSVLYRIPEDDSAATWIGALEDKHSKVSAVLVGPGWGTSPLQALLLEEVLTWNEPLVLDADALTLVARDTRLMQLLSHRHTLGQETILTPHEGEAKRLALSSTLGDLWSDHWSRLEKAKNSAEQWNSIFILKGEASVIAAADGRLAYINPTGGPGLAKGGSGDILAGMIASLCAQQVEPYAAAALGTFLHGLAGDSATRKCGWRGHLPTDTLAALNEILRTDEEKHKKL